MAHILYTKSDGYNTRVICERPEWKNCPEHKHLTDKMPKDFLSKNDEIVADIEKTSYPDEESAMIGVRQAYYSFAEAEAKRQRRNNVLNAAAWAASAGGVAVAFATGLFVFALPIVAMVGWKTQNYFESKK